MEFKKSVVFLFFLLVVSSTVFAQDDDFQSSLNSQINKMKHQLNLTDDQAAAIKPIVKDYWIKRSAVLEQVAGQGIVDHISLKSNLKALRDNEYQQLGKIFTADQMQQWIDRENLMASLNPDGGQSSPDDGPTLTADGANFKF